MFTSKWNSVLFLIWGSWIIFMTPFCANDSYLFFSKISLLFLLFTNQLSVGWSSAHSWNFLSDNIISSSLKQSHVTSHMSVVCSSSAMQCWFTDTMASHLSSFKTSLSTWTWSLRKQLEMRIKKQQQQYSSSLTRASQYLAEHPASSESQQILG